MAVLVGSVSGGVRRARMFRRALAQLAAAALLLGLVEAALVVAGPITPAWVSFAIPVTAGIYLAAGLLAWLRRPSNGIGPLLAAGSLTLLTAGLGNTEVPVLIAVGNVVATAILALVVHLLVAFPSGRLLSTGARILVASAYATAIVLQAPLYLFAAFPPPYDALQVADRPDLLRAGIWLQRGVGLAVMAVTAMVLARRLRSALPSQRRVLLPLYAYGIAAVLFIPLSGTVLGPLLDWSPATTFVLQLAVLALIPVAFGWCILRGGFARTAEVEELGAWLGAEQEVRPSLREALAGALGDPSLELGLWMPDRGYVDVDGRPVEIPAIGSGRASVDVDLAGQRVGAISYDSTLITDPELVRTAGRVVAIAVDRVRLTADLRANQEELRQSRRRIVDAGDRERRRVERNLHDGAQQRMVSLALALRLAESSLDGSDPATRALLAEAAAELDTALGELRELARGLHPALLVDAGLGGALESLAERSTIAVQLSAPIPADLPEAIEVGAYYVVAEALTNAAKHSGAAHATVRAEVVDGCLHVEVSDDGAGGAHVIPGSGLEGLTDRVDSLGGHLHLSSPAGGGTQLVVDLPCA